MVVSLICDLFGVMVLVGVLRPHPNIEHTESDLVQVKVANLTTLWMCNVLC